VERVEIVEEPGAEWDEFALSHPHVALGHAAAWHRVLVDAYRLSPIYLAARDGAGHLVGILPLACMRTLRGGPELVSLPYLDAAGVLARDPEIERALIRSARGHARQRGARALELRRCVPTAPDADGGARVGMALSILSDEEAQWKSLSAKVRNQTRKASREGLRLADGEPAQRLRSFYEVFCVNMRDLGSPTHGRRFFEAVSHHFGRKACFIVTNLGERPVGGLVAIRFGEIASVPWASTLRSERPRCPNNLIYWEALRWAICQGARELDFGRSSRGSGTHRFKRGWGAQERALDWSRFEAGGRSLPPRHAQDSAALRHLSALWTHMPVALASWIGPRIRRLLSE
jgi:FemAB-related protein (PEP-CTERM system-associated)